MTCNLYLYDETIYEGELSDIEALLAIRGGYGFTNNITKVNVVQVTPESLAGVKEIHKQIKTKMQEVRSLQAELYDTLSRES